MPDTPETQLAYDLRMACMRLARRVRYGTTSLAPSFFAVLATVERAGATTAAELAAKERVSAPSMSRTISELAERGFIDRQQDPDDKRRIQLTITDAGREELAAGRRQRNEWMTSQVLACTPEERATLRAAADILDRVVRS